MAYGRWKRIGFAAFFLAGGLAAQQAAPKFDVVSIRVVPQNAEPLMRDIEFTPILPGGQFIDQRTGLLFMIAFAYDVTNPSVQLIGLPDWTKGQAFSVAAKPAEGFPAMSPAENREQVRLMLRAMLEDRFHLKLHVEERQEAVFQLEVAKGGFKFPEVDPPVPPATAGRVNAAMGNAGGRMIAKKATMSGMVGALPIFLKRPVIDKTGLKGYYDFDVRWTALEGTEPPPGFGPDATGLLISNLRSQFGLNLTKTTGPVKYWVVDSVEMPTGN